MADDFTGIPTERWLDLETRVRGQGTLLALLLFLLLAIVAVLAQKGIVVIPGVTPGAAGG